MNLTNMYAIQYYLQGCQMGYLAINKNGEYKVSETTKNIAEFEDEFEAVDTACETSKKIYGKVIEFSILWKP